MSNGIAFVDSIKSIAGNQCCWSGVVLLGDLIGTALLCSCATVAGASEKIMIVEMQMFVLKHVAAQLVQ